MRIVIQRVKKASVVVDENMISGINHGMLLLVGVGKGDTLETARKMALKISKLRIFEDEHGKMNKNIKEIEGPILSVPQFTLLGNTEKGNRPGFDAAASPEEAKSLWNKFGDFLKAEGIPLQEGDFGAHMEVTIVNDGPVTVIIDSHEK